VGKGDDRPKGCGRLVLIWLASALAVGFTSWLLPGVTVASIFPTAFVVALVVGLVNAVVRPLLVVLTFPVTVVTLGLFLLVINGLMLELADRLVDGFAVDGLLSAILGSIVLSIATSVLQRVFDVDE
jgi:putative membrane protein